MRGWFDYRDDAFRSGCAIQNTDYSDAAVQSSGGLSFRSGVRASPSARADGMANEQFPPLSETASLS